MSIETLLTLGLAAGLLAGAAVLRLIVLGLLSVGLHLAGRDRRWLHPARVAAGEATPRPHARPRAQARSAPALRKRSPQVARIGNGLSLAGSRIRPLLSAAGTGGMLVLATLATWIRLVARGIAAGASWLGPRLAARIAGLGAALAAGLRWLGPRILLVAATIQHVLASAFAALRSAYEAWSESRQTQESLPRPVEPETHNVIHLDQSWDPLDPNWDPLTDDWPEDSVTRL